MLDAVQWLTEPANMRMRQKLRHREKMIQNTDIDISK